jgi:hypothetical protein
MKTRLIGLCFTLALFAALIAPVALAGNRLP